MWSRRGCRGLHLQCGAASNGDSRSYGDLGIPAPYGILPSPVFEASARFVGKYRTRRWRRIPTRKLHPSTVVVGTEGELPIIGGEGGAKEQVRLFWDKISEGGTPPSHRYLGIFQTTPLVLGQCVLRCRGRRRQETSCGGAGDRCKRRSRRSSPPTHPKGAREV